VARLSGITQKPEAPATERNREAILDVLRSEFAGVSSVLEIGSGTGQHAVYFGQKLPWLNWQTSDREENHDGINAWLGEASLANICRPLTLDVEVDNVSPGTYDGVFSANTAHIMSLAAVKCMFRIVAECMLPGGRFCLYGPFNLAGAFTSESNRVFDASLKARDSLMGIRDLENLHDLAAENRLEHLRSYAMPANNMLVVWRALNVRGERHGGV
jgi:SAM-dependent methyltransferase